MVCAHQDGGSEPDLNLIMVRARLQAHLDSLQNHFPTVDELSYSNFKGEAERSLGHNGRDYVDVLHEVWSLTHGLQEREKG